ncbi:MAG: hypothetical protein ACI9OJ_004729, partial [Myxococcota bacterium]
MEFVSRMPMRVAQMATSHSLVAGVRRHGVADPPPPMTSSGALPRMGARRSDRQLLALPCVLYLRERPVIVAVVMRPLGHGLALPSQLAADL